MTASLTKTQLEWLQWLHDNGGSGYCERGWVIAQGHKSLYGSATSFLHLVAKGAIEARQGRLVITDVGKRCLGIQLPTSDG